MNAKATRTGALATDGDCREAETGELRLLAAVLERAVLDARSSRADAVAWLASDDGGVNETGWRYADLCELLAIDPAWGRAQVTGGARPRRPATRFRRLEAA